MGNLIYRISEKQLPDEIPSPTDPSIEPVPEIVTHQSENSPQESFTDVTNQSHPLLEQPSIKLFCQCCKKQITNHVYSLSDKKEMCIGCLANLETFPNEYEIIEKLDFPLIETPWSAYQEVLLLASVQKWGFGNWKDVQQYMEYFGAKFTQYQIETHYNTFYLSDKSFQPRFCQILIDRKKQPNSSNLKFITQNQISIASLTTNARQDSLYYTFEQIDDFSHEPHTETLVISTPTQIKGYNPFRKEFQVDFDQNAQKNIASLEFRDDDLPQEREIKYKMLQEYNLRLRKRYEVQDFIVEHKLLDTEYQKQVEENRTEYEKVAAAELKQFMRFSSLNVHNQLIRRVAFEKQLKSIIEGMRSFRRISNTGRLKQTFQNLRRQSVQNASTTTRSRGRPRKIIHVENSQKSTTSNSQPIPLIKNSRHEEELFKRLNINLNDLKCIIKQSGHKTNGDTFNYKGVEVMVVERT